MAQSVQYTLMDGYAVRAITSSTNASPIVVTDNNHGLETGDQVTIFGHATNTAANGLWTITKVSDNTFSLDGSTGNGTGGATGVWAQVQNPTVFVEDFSVMSISIDTDGGGDAAFTLKLWSSDQQDPPNPGAAQSPSNQYDFVDMIDKEDGASIDGDTGFVVASSDDNRQFEANTNGARWMGILPTAGTEGEATVKFRLFKRPTP